MADPQATVKLMPAEPVLGQAEQAYREGNSLGAYDLARTLGPLESWPGACGLRLAALLAEDLGAPRLGRRLSVQAFWHYPTSADVWPGYVRTVAHFRGPFVAWLRVQELPKPEPTTAHAWSDWFATRARLAAQLRDFEEARRWLAEAELRTPGSPSVAVERAEVLTLEGLPPEALAAVHDTLNRHPYFRPAIQTKARLLRLLGRDPEALELLRWASAQMECGAITSQLAALQMDLGQYTAAEQSYVRCAALWPLAEPGTTQSLLARRADAACLSARYDAALVLARQVGSPFYRQLVTRLETGTVQAKRVLLPLRLTRQAQASSIRPTLTALSQFWGKLASQVEAAEAIEGDGTSARKERRWAEEHGWTAREFTVCWDSAVALLDRGVPFTLTTEEITGSCLRVVVGFDTLRKTLLVCDSSSEQVAEWPANQPSIQSPGPRPRGMAMVPDEKAELLVDLELAEAGLYERLHKLFLALQRHDRRKAAGWLAELQQVAPKHRLTFTAQRLLAEYDENAIESLSAVESLLAIDPEDTRLQLERLELLKRCSTPARRLKLLRESCRKPGTHPLLLLEFALALDNDPREDGFAVRLLNRAARISAAMAACALQLARIAWRQRDFTRALELHRYAACLDDSTEMAAQSYLIAAHHLGKTEAALSFLEDRLRRWGNRSSRPLETVFWAREYLNQLTEAFFALESALERRPGDGDLRLFAIEACVRHGNFERAHTLLEEAKDRMDQLPWLRGRARLAQAEGHFLRALDIWQQVLETEPLALDANAAVVELLSLTEGPGAGARHLRLVCARFPRHLGLHGMWLHSMRHEPAREIAPVIQRVLAIQADTARAQAELAVNLSEQGDHKGAFQAARRGLEIEPESSEAQRVLSVVLARADHPDESQEAVRVAIRLSADNRAAIEQLLDAARSVPEQLTELAWIAEEFIRQPMERDGWLAYREWAVSVMEPEALLTVLQRAHQARPELWHAWSALVLQLLDLKRIEEALALVRVATGRFPLCSTLWLHLSLVHRARQDRALEMEALGRAMQVDPANTVTADRLATACEQAGDLPRALQVLQAVCVRAAADAQAQFRLASVLWQLNQRELAISQIRKAIVLDPFLEPAWSAVREWAVALDDPGMPLRFARELTETCPGDARVWLALAHVLHQKGDLEEAAAAADRAVRLRPRFTDAYEFQTQLYVALKNKEAALEACRGRVWAGNPPVVLQGRAAWVEAELSSLSLAVRTMQGVLANHPMFYWGWNMLAEWLCRQGAEDGAIHAASQMARLSPFSAAPLAYRAKLRIQRHDRVGAKADLRQALKLDPNNEPAASSLFDLLMAGEEFDAAEGLLADIQRHFQGYLPVACETRLRAERSRRSLKGPRVSNVLRGEELTQALTRFRELCMSRLEEVRPLETAFKSLQRSRCEVQADKLIGELLKSPAASPFVGALWVRRQVAKRHSGLEAELKVLLDRGEVGRKAVIAYLEVLATRSSVESLQRLIAEHKPWLSSDDQGWEAVGLALGKLSLQEEFFDWMQDWRERPAVSPELRLTLVQMLRRAGQDQEADEAARSVPAGASRNPAVHRLRTWVAIEAAIAGASERGQLALEGIDPVLLDDYHRHLECFAHCLIEVQCAPAEDLAQIRQGAIERMEQAASNAKAHKADPAMHRLLRRAINRLARDCGRPTLRLWLWSKL